MNGSLFRSPRAIALTVLLVGLFFVWWLQGGFRLGRGADSDTGYLLWSGWIALGMYVVVIAYVGRKYVHRLKPAPKPKDLEPKALRLEKAASAIKQLENDIRRGVLKERKDILQKARFIVQQNGVHKLVRPVLEERTDQIPPIGVELVSREPAGRVLVWMHLHLYLGVGAGIVVWLHGGGVLTTPMGFLLNVLSFIVIATGVVGIYFWSVGPSRLAAAEQGLSLEKAHALAEHFDRKLEAGLQDAKDEAGLAELAKMKSVFASLGSTPNPKSVITALAGTVAEDAKIAEKQRDLMVLYCQQQRCKVALQRMARTKFLLNFWRLAHIPASIVLVGLLVFHVMTVWWY